MHFYVLAVFIDVRSAWWTGCIIKKITKKEDKQIFNLQNRLIDIKLEMLRRKKIKIDDIEDDENDPINRINDALFYLGYI